MLLGHTHHATSPSQVLPLLEEYVISDVYLLLDKLNKNKGELPQNTNLLRDRTLIYTQKNHTSEVFQFLLIWNLLRFFIVKPLQIPNVWQITWKLKTRQLYHIPMWIYKYKLIQASDKFKSYFTPNSRAQLAPEEKRKMESPEEVTSSKDATGTWTLSWKPGVPTTSIFCFFF